MYTAYIGEEGGEGVRGGRRAWGREGGSEGVRYTAHGRKERGSDGVRYTAQGRKEGMGERGRE